VEQEAGKPGRFGDGSERVIGACIEVHRQLGPGLLESAYEVCLAHELELRGFRAERQRPVPLRYKGISLDCGYRLDLVVDDALVIEIKAVERLLPIHQAQLLTYLKLTELHVGLLVNFHSVAIKNNLRRLTWSPTFPASRLPVNLPQSHVAPSAPQPCRLAPLDMRRFMIGLLWFGSVATVAYWVIWFFVDRSWLATADTPAYYAFENAFPLADAWMAVTGALAAIALQRGRPSALLWMLLAGSATLFLGGMDVLFDLENGIYRHGDPGNVAVELLINVGCLAGGTAVIRYAWRNRRTLLGG
jgi:GxxExxY protein